jgi:5-(carboxyamino)imidazole ribonucleotide mutase
MSTEPPVVGVVMGSQSDWDTMSQSVKTLKDMKIPCEYHVLSAHRNSEQLAEYTKSARDRGLKVIIAGAGMAAALPGAIAAMTPLPVLGVPMETRCMGGLDSLLSMVQMPRGIPVGTLAIGKAGAVNAALLAAAIIALQDNEVEARLDAFRTEQSSVRTELPDL